MQTTEMIIFLIIFVGILLVACIKINKETKLIKDKLSENKRKALEAENTEFDYGHNINNKEE